MHMQRTALHPLRSRNLLHNPKPPRITQHARDRVKLLFRQAHPFARRLLLHRLPKDPSPTIRCDAAPQRVEETHLLNKLELEEVSGREDSGPRRKELLYERAVQIRVTIGATILDNGDAKIGIAGLKKR